MIKLVGQSSDYVLGASPEGLPFGTGILVNDGMSPELIGIVAGFDPNALDLDNSHQFMFEPF